MRCLTLAATILLTTHPASAGVIHRVDQEPLIGPLERGSVPSRIRIWTVNGVVQIARADALRIETDETLRRTLENLTETLSPDDAAGAGRASRWAVRKGLFEEALHLADRAMRADPNLGLDLTEYLPLPVLGIDAAAKIKPKDAWHLLTAAADPDQPATGAVAIARLSKLAVAQDVDAALEKALGKKDAALRSAAIQVIQAATPATLWPDAMRLSLFDPAPAIRGLATLAAAAYDDPRMVRALERALLEGNAPIREAAMDAIETLEEERALGALVLMLRRRAESGPARAYVYQGEQQTFVSDFDVDVANSAFIANPNIGVLQTGGVLDTALLATSPRRFPAAHHRRAAEILQRLTGKDFGVDADRWDAWIRAKAAEQDSP